MIDVFTWQDLLSRHIVTVVIASTILFAADAELHGQTVTYQTIALTGDNAPGTMPTTNLRFFDEPVLNAGGDVAFVASLSGPDVKLSNNEAFFSNAGGTLRKIAREGEPAPGIGTGVNFSEFGFPVLNNVGEVSILVELTGPDVDVTNDVGILLDSGGRICLVARTGNPAPGSSEDFDFLNCPRLNNQGQVMFSCFLTVNGTAIYRQTNNMLAPFVLDGDAVPGAKPGLTFFGFGSPVTNDLGAAAFRARLAGEQTNTSNNSGIFSSANGSLAFVAREGDSAPGAGAGVVFDDFDSFQRVGLNESGQLVFHAELEGPGVTLTNNEAIFVESGGRLDLIVREGDPAPGTEPGVSILQFLIPFPFLDNQGQVSFLSGLTGLGVDATNNQAIFSESNGVLGLVVRAGETAAGTEPGVTFGSFFEFVANNTGQMLFAQHLPEPVSTPRTTSGCSPPTFTATLISLFVRETCLM